MSKKKIDRSSVYKERLASLKKLGYLKDIPAKSAVDNKTAINKSWSKFKSVAARPDAFSVKSTEQLNKKEIKMLKDTGYLVSDGKVFIPKNGAKTVRLAIKTVKNEKGNYEPQLQITRTKHSLVTGKPRLDETEYIGTNIDKLNWRDRLLREHRDGKFRENEQIGIRVFENNTFHTTVISIDSLFNYAENIHWHDGASKDKMLANIHLVKIRTRNAGENGNLDLLKTQKQIDKDKYEGRKRKRKFSLKSTPRSKK